MLTVLIATACQGEEATLRTQPALAVQPRGIVDSILTVEEQIRRFKVARHDVTAHELAGGATTRDVLVSAFVKAVETHDTATFRKLVLNAGEFIDLYYPTSMYAQSPYKQDPELRWFLMQESSHQGLHRLLQRYGGRPAGFSGYDCASEPVTEGKNRIWDRCAVTWSQHSKPIRLFSTIIERNGRFKIMSYANDL